MNWGAMNWGAVAIAAITAIVVLVHLRQTRPGPVPAARSTLEALHPTWVTEYVISLGDDLLSPATSRWVAALADALGVEIKKLSPGGGNEFFEGMKPEEVEEIVDRRLKEKGILGGAKPSAEKVAAILPAICARVSAE